jgi:S1-C subfamily serine protease
VYAIGAPLDAGTFTNGIVSHIDQQVHQTNAGLIAKFWQATLNSQAQVIGVNAVVNQGPVIGTDGQRIATGEGNMGIGFAISVDRVKPF